MSYEPDYDVWDITVDEGKYRFASTMNREHPDAGPSRVKKAWRRGEWWQAGYNWLIDMILNKSFATIMTEFNTARAALRVLHREIDPSSLTATSQEMALVVRAFKEAGE